MGSRSAGKRTHQGRTEGNDLDAKSEERVSTPPTPHLGAPYLRPYARISGQCVVLQMSRHSKAFARESEMEARSLEGQEGWVRMPALHSGRTMATEKLCSRPEID